MLSGLCAIVHGNRKAANRYLGIQKYGPAYIFHFFNRSIMVQLSAISHI